MKLTIVFDAPTYPTMDEYRVFLVAVADLGENVTVLAIEEEETTIDVLAELRAAVGGDSQ